MYVVQMYSITNYQWELRSFNNFKYIIFLVDLLINIERLTVEFNTYED